MRPRVILLALMLFSTTALADLSNECPNLAGVYDALELKTSDTDTNRKYLPDELTYTVTQNECQEVTLSYSLKFGTQVDHTETMKIVPDGKTPTLLAGFPSLGMRFLALYYFTSDSLEGKIFSQTEDNPMTDLHAVEKIYLDENKSLKIVKTAHNPKENKTWTREILTVRKD